MADGFRLRLFGPPALLDGGGRALHFRTKKQMALLVYLHFEARTHPVSRDVLVDLLWPEVSADKGRHSLSQALSAVRARLGERAVNARTDIVGLVAPLLTELDLLEAGDEVVDVAHPLRDLDACAGADFAHWVDSARERILSAARERLAAGLREARSRGNLTGVARRALLLQRVDPVNPAAVIALAERGLLDGDTIGAMRTLREYVRRVEQELGTNPHPEIAALLRRLEHGEGPALESSTPLAQIAQRRREVFVGREAELARLEGLWQRGREESFVSCLVTGVAGIGKSSLVRRFATSVAARTNPVFVVTCQEIGGGIPFAAVSDLILAISRDPAAGGTEPLWLAEASRVSPGLRAAYPGIPEAPQAPAESVRLRVAEALVRMIEAVAEQRPVLVVFDDVQHMDPASRDVLFLFTRRLERLHVVLIGSLRTADSPRPPVTETETLGWQEALELAPLAEGHVKDLIEGLSQRIAAPDDRIRTTIAGLAQGNPYHVEMLLSDWRQHASASLVAAESAGDATAAAWNPPETLRLAFARQYQGLSSDARHGLHVLAVAGKALPTGQLAELLCVDRALIDRAILELLDRGLLRVVGGQFYFKNELHRAFVYYAMSSDARRYFHAKLAQKSWQGWDTREFQRALEASHHFARAGMRDEAVNAAISGVESALTRGAPHEARRALGSIRVTYPRLLPPRLHLLLARATLLCGEYAATLDALAGWEPNSRDGSEKALAAQLRAEALHRGRLADNRTISEAAKVARRLAEETRDEESLVRALQIEAEVAADLGLLEPLEEIRDAARESSRASRNSECLALSRMTQGYCEWVSGDFEAAAEIFSKTAALFEELSLHEDYRRVLNGLGMSYTGLGRFSEAEHAFQKALVIAQRLGNPLAVSNVWSNLASLNHDMGRFQDAAHGYRMAIKTSGSSTVRFMAVVYADIARLSIELGNPGEAEQFCTASFEAGERSGLHRQVACALLVRADLFLAQAMPEMAWPLVERAVALVANQEHSLSDVGQFERLRLHLLWVTKGYGAVAESLDRDMRRRCRRLVDQLEVEAFMAWLASVERDDRRASADKTLSLIRSHGVCGVLARLVAVGVDVPGVPRPNTGESSAQLVARLFPAVERALVPTAVGLAELDVEL